MLKANAKINIHVYPSNLKNESRILKITNSLVKNEIFDRIEVVGKWEPGLPLFQTLENGVVLRRLCPGFAFGTGSLFRFLKVTLWYLRALLVLIRLRPACINAHSLPVLPLCALVKLFTNAYLIYDTHELETEVSKSRGMLRHVFKLTEATFIKYCDVVCVVNLEISKWYQERYRLQKVWVVENVPVGDFSLAPRKGKLRASLGIKTDALIFLYQGLLARGRGIEVLLEAFQSGGGDRHLVLMGYGPMQPLVLEYSNSCKNIHFHPAVPPDQIPLYSADADVGVSLVENVCLSYYLSLPNKLFEYISAGVPVLASNFPVMSRVVNGLGCGWTIPPDRAEISNFLISITVAEIRSKAAAAMAARSGIGWRYQEAVLLQMYSLLKI